LEAPRVTKAESGHNTLQYSCENLTGHWERERKSFTSRRIQYSFPSTLISLSFFTAPTSCNYFETYTNAFPTIRISLVHLLFCDQSLSTAPAAHQCSWRKKIAGSCQKHFYHDLHKAFVGQHLQQASHGFWRVFQCRKEKIIYPFAKTRDIKGSSSNGTHTVVWTPNMIAIQKAANDDME
jgi:hypothetical protein